MKKSTYSSIAAGTAIVIAMAIGLWVWLHPKPKIHYVTTPVTMRDVQSTVLAIGTLTASDLVNVGAQASGQIKSLKVKLGQQVKKGQLIAEIDSTPQVNALHTAAAELQSLEAQLRSANATLRQSQLALTRQRYMLAHDAGVRQDTETAEANEAVAQASAASLRAQIVAAKIAVDTARVTLGYTQIVAPIDGVVVAILSVEGQTVNANQITPNIVKIANLDSMTVKAQISEADVVHVRPGQKAYFTILGDPDKRYATTLRAVEPAPDSMAVDSPLPNAAPNASSNAAVYYNGLLDIPNKDGRLRISMTAQVTILLAEAHNALVIPSSALQAGHPNGKGTVRLLDAEGKVVTRSVRIGLDDHVVAQVLDGLKLGDKVIVGVSHPGAPNSPWSGEP